MVFDYILAGVAAVGIGIIITILVRTFPKLRAIDTGTIPSEREAKKKNDLIEQRLGRKFGAVRSLTVGRMGELILRARQFARQGYWRLRETERSYRQKARLQQSPAQRAELQRKVGALLDEASSAMKEEKFSEAEQRCIEAIGLEPKSLTAYQRLGDVYVGSKDFHHAQEVYGHAIELSRRKYRIKGIMRGLKGTAQEYGGNTSDVAELHSDLAGVFQQLGRLPEALVNCKEAIRLVPNNPKFLYEQFQYAIEAKEKVLAISTLDSLRAANPDNQRLAELEAQLKTLDSAPRLPT